MLPITFKASLAPNAAVNSVAVPAMTANQFKHAIASLHLDQGQAGEFLGRSREMINAYANDRAPIDKPIALLLRVMLRAGLKPSDID
jgi:hypothetical protein